MTDNTALAVAITMTVITAILFALGVLGPARAHEALPTAAAPLGWAYGYECCALTDCSRSNDGDVSAVKGGYQVNRTGEIIPYNDRRIKRSRDEFYHRCAPGGDVAAPKSICLYVPDQGF